MMNKISLGLSISSFVLILIMFVFGNIDLEFDTNETESLRVNQHKINICDEGHELYYKTSVEWYNNLPDGHKNIFTCEETISIDNAIHLHIDDHEARDPYNPNYGIHHTHIKDIYGKDINVN